MCHRGGTSPEVPCSHGRGADVHGTPLVNGNSPEARTATIGSGVRHTTDEGMDVVEDGMVRLQVPERQQSATGDMAS